MVQVPQASGPPAPSIQQAQQAPPQAANTEVDMLSVLHTGVSIIIWNVMLRWSNVNFSCSSGYFAFTNSLFMLPYFDLGHHQYFLGTPISYVICLAFAALKAMLHEAIFLATRNATMTNKKTFKLQRVCYTLATSFATCNAYNNKQDGGRGKSPKDEL